MSQSKAWKPNHLDSAEAPTSPILTPPAPNFRLTATQTFAPDSYPLHKPLPSPATVTPRNTFTRVPALRSAPGTPGGGREEPLEPVAAEAQSLHGAGLCASDSLGSVVPSPTHRLPHRSTSSGAGPRAGDNRWPGRLVFGAGVGRRRALGVSDSAGPGRGHTQERAGPRRERRGLTGRSPWTRTLTGTYLEKQKAALTGLSPGTGAQACKNGGTCLAHYTTRRDPEGSERGGAEKEEAWLGCHSELGRDAAGLSNSERLITW
ncbi:hypothetical protein P7K49_030247 [Saguinus oedipus]|uniref:Uncharacterized protein n=1 Tax=Saguinus oedipus TaxID=9490 RepID=A0ABQ9U1N5_SAGOE|nr:hypothetical protein P7K49_030247 [Saguinus oedipus]